MYLDPSLFKVALMDTDDDLLLLEEVAKRCRAPLSSVRHWVRVGKLSSIRPGRRRLVSRNEIERFLREQSSASTKTAR